MTSTTHLTRGEAVALRDSLTEILDNKDLNHIQIVHTKGEIHVTRSGDKLQPLNTKAEIDIHDCSDAD